VFGGTEGIDGLQKKDCLIWGRGGGQIGGSTEKRGVLNGSAILGLNKGWTCWNIMRGDGSNDIARQRGQ